MRAMTRRVRGGGARPPVAVPAPVLALVPVLALATAPVPFTRLMSHTHRYDDTDAMAQ